MSADEYSALQSHAASSIRLKLARELTEQAEELLRVSEHHTFDSALALLERLRAQEPANLSTAQRIADALNSAAQKK